MFKSTRKVVVIVAIVAIVLISTTAGIATFVRVRERPEASPYCRHVESLDEKSPTLEVLASGDEARLRASVDEWLRAMHQVRREAPSEVQPEVRALVARATAFAGFLESHDYDLIAASRDPRAESFDPVPQELRSKDAALEGPPELTPRIHDFQSRVDAYNDRDCSTDADEPQ